MQNKKIALIEGVFLIILILIAVFKDSIIINLPLASLISHTPDTQFYFKFAFFSLVITLIIEYFFVKNWVKTFFSAKCAGILCMTLVIIFGFYLKKNYIEFYDFNISLLTYCFACIVCQGTSYIVMINKKFDRSFRILNMLMIMMSINVMSVLSIKLLKLLNLIGENYIYTAEKIITYIIGFTVAEIIGYIVFVFKESAIYFEKISIICIVGCSILIFIL